MVSGGIGVVQLIAVLPAIVWIDKIGRKPLLRGHSFHFYADDVGTDCVCTTGGSTVMALSHLGIALLVISFQSNWEAHRLGAWMAVGYVLIVVLPVPNSTVADTYFY